MGNESSQPEKVGEMIENDIEVSWRPVEGERPGLQPRDGHCAASVGGKLFIFGGVIQTSQDDSCETNQLLCLDVESSTWSSLSVNGEVPAARSAATMAAVGSNLFLFGGLSQNHGWFDDVHKFDTTTSTWSLVKAEGSAPSARDKLASSAIDTKIYLFGGFGPQTSEDDDDEEWEDEDEGVPQDQQAAQFGWFDDLFVFDTTCNKWSQPLQMNLGAPTPRAAHSMCAVKNFLCIFGGRDSKSRVNDLHIFNTESRKWVKPCVRGRSPAARSFHTATTVGQRVVVLGGRGTNNQHFTDLHIFDVETMQWLQPLVEGDSPPGRGLHTASLVGDKLIVFGGSADFNPETMQCTKYFNDAFFINAGEIMSGRPKSDEGKGDKLNKESEGGSTSASQLPSPPPDGSGESEEGCEPEKSSPSKKPRLDPPSTDDVVRGAAVESENQENVSDNIQQTSGKSSEDVIKSPNKAPLGASSAGSIGTSE